MGLLSYTKRKGKKLLCCICHKSSKETQQRHLPSPRFPCQQTLPPIEEKKKKRFWRKKKNKGNKHKTNNYNLPFQYEEQQQQFQLRQHTATRKKKRFWRWKKQNKNKIKPAIPMNSIPMQTVEAIQQPLVHFQTEQEKKNKKNKRLCWRRKKEKKNKQVPKMTPNNSIRPGELHTSRLSHIEPPRQSSVQSTRQKLPRLSQVEPPRQSFMQQTRQMQVQPQKEKKKRNLCGIRKKKKNKKRQLNFGEPTYLYEEQELRQVKDKPKKKRRILCWRRKSKKERKEQKEKREKKEKKEQSVQQREPNGLARLVNSLSFQSDSHKHRAAAQEILRIGNENIPSRVFTLDELKAATKNFSPDNLLGEGGFGRVYLGRIPDTNEMIGVKQLDRHGLQGNREFLVEVLMLSLLHHPNLVNLLGYCVENGQRILVYEYMQLGSLQDHLLDHSRDEDPLDWAKRMKIAAGAAKGLEFLHDSANPPVIYRDLKASNILLGQDFHPKLSDFGLAKLGPVGEKTHVTTRVMGTYGYCAPEYALTGKLTKMSDVYSFGVVLLELITGRRAVDTTKPTREQILVQWAAPLFRDKSRYTEMADPLLRGQYPIKGLYQALAISAMCLQEEAESRPVISDVVTALQFLANPKPDVLDTSDELYPPPGHMPSSSDIEIEMCDDDDSDDFSN